LLLLAWQNYWMLIGWEEYNYFINCTAVQLMIFPKQTKWRKGILNTNVKWNCPWGTRWKYKQKCQILVESLAGHGFGDRIWSWRRCIQSCHANNKQVIMKCCSYNSKGLIILVMFGNLPNWTRPVQFWQNFQTSLVLLIPNCRLLAIAWLPIHNRK
jgi:hypothetical protein